MLVLYTKPVIFPSLQTQERELERIVVLMRKWAKENRISV